MSSSLDMSVVETLKELGGDDDPELFGELVDAFLADTPGRLDAIDAALVTGDADGVAKAAHPLKSSAANMGAVGLSELCRRMEAAAREGDLSGLAPLAASARVEFDAASRALQDAR